MQENNIPDVTGTTGKRSPRLRARKIIYGTTAVLILIVVCCWIMLASFPNAIIHYIVEPKLKQLVVDRLGRRYSLQIRSITLSENKDSLILTGVHIIDNGKTTDGSSDTSNQNFGVATPLDRLTTDTVLIAGLDYWKLIFQKGLFADSITINSPSIFLRPGTLPKFAENADFLPSFLPAVSSKLIKVENARIYFSEGIPLSGGNIPKNNRNMITSYSGNVVVKKASLTFRNFFLDEPTYKKAISTFFCSSAKFHAEDISHIDSLGVTDIHVTSVDGDLIDSSMSVIGIESKKPIEEIRRIAIRQIDFTGLDWYTALAGHGLHGAEVSINAPQIYLQDIKDFPVHSSLHLTASDLISLPSLLPAVSLAKIEITNAELHALLPKTDHISSLTRIKMKLDEFRIDSTTPFANITTFFSHRATFAIEGESSITTSFGKLRINSITGTEKTLGLAFIRIEPSVKGLKLIQIRSIQIDGLDIWKLLMRDGFYSESTRIHEPVIYLERGLTQPITSLNSVLGLNPLELIREITVFPLPLLLPASNIGTITVSGGSIHGIHFFDDPKNSSVEGDSITGMGVTLSNFKLDKNSWVQNRGMLFSHAGVFSIGSFTQHNDRAIYTYSEKSIKGDLRRQTFTIDSVIIHPLIPEDSFGAAFKYRTERISFMAPKVKVSGVDYKKLFTGSGMFADSIHISNWKMHVYGDRRLPEELRVETSKYPHELFQQITMPLAVHGIVLNDGEFTFRESWPDTTVPGTIPLNHVNMRIGSISNKKNVGFDSTLTPVEGDLKIMNSGLVTFSLGYQLLNPHFSLDLRGKLGAIDAALFNEYLAKTEPFTLTGNVRSAEFNIKIRDSLMTGTLTPQYDSLHVTFFRWDKFPPGLVSFLANAFFMRSHNIPELDRPLHSAEISAVLGQNTSLFWALWLPIRSGIGSIVRIPEWVW